MLIHIVKTGDTVDKIVDSYRVLKEDLISNNLHITDFSHLKSGMKLKIPLISKDIMETLEETEAFIDDYYPSFENFLSNNEKIKDEEIYSKTDIINESSVNEKEQPISEVIKEVRSDKPHNKAIYSANSNNLYFGNIAPNIDDKFIKKI